MHTRPSVTLADCLALAHTHTLALTYSEPHAHSPTHLWSQLWYVNIGEAPSGFFPWENNWTLAMPRRRRCECECGVGAATDVGMRDWSWASCCGCSFSWSRGRSRSRYWSRQSLLTLSKLHFGTGNAIYILLGASALNKLACTRLYLCCSHLFALFLSLSLSFFLLTTHSLAHSVCVRFLNLQTWACKFAMNKLTRICLPTRHFRYLLKTNWQAEWVAYLAWTLS